MADGQDSQREVLTSLPRTRPVRRSAKRAQRTSATSGATAARRRETTATKAKPARATTAKATAKPKAAAAATAKPAAKPKAKAKPKPKPQAQAAAQPGTAPKRKVPPAGYAAPDQRAADAPSSAAADLVSTTIQAAAELAQIGVTIGRQTLRSMLDRLPKP